ncbi:DUF4870 family protein [Agaribacterium haliotis]|uniref:DUF4870 family protein n=1 Tax=Agaribacterium haliotis TaxID=2013869 RepID=UPI000BB57618|nr:DUF4870 domain-containing protein [Agaribacterium haliotis]
MSDSADNQAKELANTSNPKLVYILYLVGILLGFTGIIGVIIAYINKSDAPEWIQSHYRFQIRTFWIGLLYSVIAMILTTVIVGFFVLVFVLIWLIIRCVKGMKYLDKGEAYPEPSSWMF